MAEPLLHFFLLGGLIFAAYATISGQDALGQDTIVVTRGKLEELEASFARSWHRQPNEAELKHLISDYVREEIAVREAEALGMDRDDAVIRRRLRQKVEFVNEDRAGLAEPDDTQLQDFLQDHAEAYRIEPRFSFSQIYFNPKRKGIDAASDAYKLRDRLNAQGGSVDPIRLGDATALDHQFSGLPLSEVKQLFGEPFAMALRELEPGCWVGPVDSGYGKHLVFIHERIEGGLPKLEQVRDAVRRDWITARQTDAIEQFYAARLPRYTVRIDSPKPQTDGQQAATLP